jgi:hypothetical protein
MRLEALDDRLVPATFGYDTATDTMSIAGTVWADTITVIDHGDGRVTASDETGTPFTFGDVDRLYVTTFGGDDVVRYKLDGVVERDLEVDVELGGDDDRFTGTLNRDIAESERLTVTVYGGGGDDLITLYGTPTAPARAGDWLTNGLTINAGGLKIGTGAALIARLDGGDGGDRVYADYQGELNGTLHVVALGGGGADIVSALVRLQAGSWGQVGSGVLSPSAVSGGTGADDLTFHVFDESGNARPVLATIHGGETARTPSEPDRGSRTQNVAHAGGVDSCDIALAGDSINNN